MAKLESHTSSKILEFPCSTAAVSEMEQPHFFWLGVYIGINKGLTLIKEVKCEWITAAKAMATTAQHLA